MARERQRSWFGPVEMGDYRLDNYRLGEHELEAHKMEEYKMNRGFLVVRLCTCYPGGALLEVRKRVGDY